MEQLAILTDQTIAPAERPWMRPSRHSADVLAGFQRMDIWSGAAQQIRDNLISAQSSDEQPNAPPETAEDVLQGRVTGPVRLIQQVTRAWSLRDDEVARLLAYPAAELASRVLKGFLTFDTDDADRADRARLLYFIHDTLSDLFVEREDEERWMRNPLPAFNNVSPLAYMVERRIPGMVAVRAFVEQRLANR